MDNSSYFRFDDDSKTKFEISKLANTKVLYVENRYFRYYIEERKSDNY